MRFDIITLFPQPIVSYFQQGILERAQEDEYLSINVHDLRKWTDDRHKTVDDKPYGGGGGMILKVQPIYQAVDDIQKEDQKSKVVLLSPRGEKFTQNKATRWSSWDQLILISGRYEGVDERVAQHIADDVVSIGDYVLMGGDLPAMVITETIARLIPGVAGDNQWLQKRVEKKGFRTYPQYTRPEVFATEEGEEWKVPSVLLSGNHQKVDQWREDHQQVIE